MNVYGSISSSPGTFGKYFFTQKFIEYDIPAIYLPFKVSNTRELHAILSCVDIIGLKGLGISMPWKRIIINHATWIDPLVKRIGNANTLTFGKNGSIKAYNTDYHSIRNLINEIAHPLGQPNFVAIIGNGAYADTAKCAFSDSIYFNQISGYDRRNKDDIKRIISNKEITHIFNATPDPILLETETRKLTIINASVDTPFGNKLALAQAQKQFEIYTGI